MIERNALSTNTLVPFLEPRSVAIVGASAAKGSIGQRVLQFLRQGGFRGAIYPVNPRYTEVDGLECFSSLGQISQSVDAIVVAVAAKFVPEIIAQAVDADVRAAVILSAGFAEIGTDGQKLQRDISNLIQSSGMRILGPNCVGLMNTSNGFTATFTTALDVVRPRPGDIGLITQSGAFGAYCLTLFPWEKAGIRYWVSTGNEIDVDVSDWIQYMTCIPDISVLGVYIESLKDGSKFRRALQQASESGKPIVIIKPARSEEGASAVQSHTASITGSDLVFDSIIREFDVIRTYSAQEFIDIVSVRGHAPRLTGRRVGLVTVSGGIGALMTDSCVAKGLQVPQLPIALQAAIKSRIPYAAVRNPVDVTGQWVNQPEILAHCLHSVAESGAVDSILAFLGHATQAEEAGPQVISSLQDLTSNLSVPLFICASGKELESALMGRPGTIVQNDLERTIGIIGALAPKEEPVSKQPLINSGTARSPSESFGVAGQEFFGRLFARDPSRRSLSESESKTLLRMSGVPTSHEKLVTCADDAAKGARELGFPVVLKLDSPDVSHRLVNGLIRVGVRGESEVREAYGDILRRQERAFPNAGCNGILVAAAVNAVAEIFVGLGTDPCFGPYVTLRPGGLWVNLNSSRSVALLPLTEAGAARLIFAAGIDEALSKGVRDWTAIRGKLIEVLLRLGQIGKFMPSPISSFDVNPLGLVVSTDTPTFIVLDSFAELNNSKDSRHTNGAHDGNGD